MRLLTYSRRRGPVWPPEAVERADCKFGGDCGQEAGKKEAKNLKIIRGVSGGPCEEGPPEEEKAQGGDKKIRAAKTGPLRNIADKAFGGGYLCCDLETF